jgi:aspartate ammonia-lyase
MREEQDFIGKITIPKDALYGIHSVRARSNFPDSTPFHKEWYQGIGLVKRACYQTYRKLRNTALEELGQFPETLTLIPDNSLEALEHSAERVNRGELFEHFIVPAIQGGAGTSINMNVNEIICNNALIQLKKQPGQYTYLDPIEHANIFQSTNDVIPTALKVTAMQLLIDLEAKTNALRKEIERLEAEYRHTLRLGYTQMQEAVPSTYGQLFSNYNNALSRDWWRISKCSERMKEINLGGGAIGTGLAIPRYFIVQVVKELQLLSGLPITRSENLGDTTSNTDSFVEVHATLNAQAVNLEKIASDIRLLGADLFKNRILQIPKKQTGSSIMPGKVNPVISEFVITAAHKIYSNNQWLTQLAGQGCLELNAYLPGIGHALIESIKLLSASCDTLTTNLFNQLSVDSAPPKTDSIANSPSITTALIPYIGYYQAGEIARYMQLHKATIFQANETLNFMPENQLKSLLTADSLLKLGYSLKDSITNSK